MVDLLSSLDKSEISALVAPFKTPPPSPRIKIAVRALPGVCTIERRKKEAVHRSGATIISGLYPILSAIGPKKSAPSKMPNGSTPVNVELCAKDRFKSELINGRIVPNTVNEAPKKSIPKKPAMNAGVLL